MWRSTVQKFSSGGSGFDPSFSETEKVRVVGVDQIRQCSRMNRMKNGADVESAVSTWMGNRLLAGVPSRHVISQLGQLSLAALRGRLIEYRLRLG